MDFKLKFSTIIDKMTQISDTIYSYQNIIKRFIKKNKMELENDSPLISRW